MDQNQIYDDEEDVSISPADGEQKAKPTWIKKISILLISIAGGLVLWTIIWTTTNSYSMPKWLCIAITIAAYSLILYLIYKGINYVAPEKKADRPTEVLIAICVLCILFQLVNSYLREDYFTQSGQSTTYIDPSTGEKWYGKHPETNPRTGIKLVLVTPEMLAKANQQIPKSGFDVIPGTGHYVYEVAKNEETNWKAVPKHLYWSLSSAKQNGDWDLIPFTGKVVTYQKDQDQLVDLTGLDNTFKIKNKGDDMVFDLIVKPRT